MNKPLPPLQGYKYLTRVAPMLERLHTCGVDKAGNRTLHYDRYVALVLLSFFNPILTSLRGLAQATTLDKVAQATSGGRVSLSALAEAPHAFDPTLVRGVLTELAQHAWPHAWPADRQALRDLVAVDGTLLRALPNRAWCPGPSNTGRAAKVHVAFEVCRAGPADATVTAGYGSERAQLRSHLLQKGRVYVLDRGYEGYELLAPIRAAGSSFVARVQADVASEVAEERPLTAADRAAGVVRAVVRKRLGSAHPKDWHKGAFVRLVVVDHPGARPGEATRL